MHDPQAKSEPNIIDPANRRPIKSRGSAVFQRMAKALAKTPITPNMISVGSVVCSALAGACFVATNVAEHVVLAAALWVTAAIMIQGRLIANLIDGLVAMEGGRATATGELFNEVPDRISDSLIFVAAGFSACGNPALGWAAATVSVFVAYVRAIGASVGAGQVFLGPMAKPQRMALMTLACLSIAVATLTCSKQSLPVLQSYLLNGTLWIVVVLGASTATRRLLVIGGLMKNNAEGRAK